MADGKIPAPLRKNMILQAIRESGFVAVPDLARKFAVSEMTARRDLDELAEQGLLSRTHGGAALDGFVPGHFYEAEPSVETRVVLNKDAKMRIARRALDYVEPGYTIALDVGSSCYALAGLLTDPSLNIFTSSLKSGTLLHQAGVTVQMPGGRLHGTEPTLTGPRAIEYLRGFRFDIAFIGVSGVSSAGLFDYSFEDTEIKRALIANAQRRVLLIDGSKFDRVSAVLVARFDEIDVLISDRDPPGEIADALRAAKVETITTEVRR